MLAAGIAPCPLRDASHHVATSLSATILITKRNEMLNASGLAEAVPSDGFHTVIPCGFPAILTSRESAACVTRFLCLIDQTRLAGYEDVASGWHAQQYGPSTIVSRLMLPGTRIW